MDAEAVHRAWQDRSGAYSPGYYAYYGRNDTSEAIRSAIDSAVGVDASVLELGCSVGRHLEHFHQGGYTELSGIEINPSAAEVMAETYPSLATAGTFYFEAIEDRIDRFADDGFDAVFTVETLQHLHPDQEWVFEEIARVTGERLITVELEPDQDDSTAGSPAVSYVDDAFPLYRRNWAQVFTPLGFEQLESRTIGTDTFRVFRAPDGG